MKIKLLVLSGIMVVHFSCRQLPELGKVGLQETIIDPLPQDQNPAWLSFRDCIIAQDVQKPAEAIACIPQGCQWLYLDSVSAQNSCPLAWHDREGCTLGRSEEEVRLPRVMVKCDEGKMMASWGFCTGYDRVEIGTQQEPYGLFMYDLRFPSPKLDPLHMDHPENICSSCHINPAEPYLHEPEPIHPNSILIRNRRNDYIEAICSEIQGKTDLGCLPAIPFESQPAQSRSGHFADLCQAILQD